MEQLFYSINELATITGFTTRSLRNFIQMGHLEGSKVDGVWQFSLNQIGDFMSNPNVAPGIRTKNNAVIYDFMAADKKEENQICSILDLKLNQDTAMKCSQYFCNAINSSESEKAALKFEMHDGYARIIISGPDTIVQRIVNGWYELLKEDNN